jgi:hypothetical protein
MIPSYPQEKRCGQNRTKTRVLAIIGNGNTSLAGIKIVASICLYNTKKDFGTYIIKNPPIM